MTPYELIDLLVVACSALLIWAVVATMSLFRERKEQKKATTEEAPDVVTTTDEITVNDKDWHIRTWLVEKLRVEIIKGLKSSHVYYLKPGLDEEGLKLSKGEEYELFLPFIKKGYFVYHEERRIHYRVTKHRDFETNDLEITEERLTKNAQL